MIPQTEISEIFFQQSTKGLSALELIFDDIHQLIDFKIIKANPSFLRLLGIDDQNFNSDSFLSNAMSIDSDEFIQSIGHLALKKQTIEIEKSFFYSTIYSILISNFSANQFTITIQDKTDEIRIVNESENSQELLERISQVAKIGYWEYDLTYFVIIWSKHTYSIHELDSNYLPNLEECLNFYSEPGRTLLRDAVTSAINKGIKWDIELPFLTSRGKKLWVRNAGEVEYKNGKPFKLLGVLQDITERKLKDELIKESETRLLEAQRIAQLGHWEYSLMKNEIVWSPQVYQIFKKNPDLYKPTFEDMFDQIIEMQEIVSIFENNESFKKDIQYIISETETIWVSIECIVVYSEDGHPTFLKGTVQDITIRKNTEIAMFEAKEEAVRLSNTKGLFLANMSHEIRTPLNGILGFSDLLRGTNLNSIQMEYANTIYDSSKSLALIINDILDFSKIESGKLELEEVYTDIRNLIKQTIDILSFSMNQKNIKIVPKISQKTPSEIQVDPVRLKQILLNLLSNAIKFTEYGEIILSLELEEVQTEISTASFCFSVIDNGIGISEENQKKLFIAFNQAETSTSRKYGGTGLGLTISNNLANLMGSTIKVLSKEGKGSTFYFHLWKEYRDTSIRQKISKEVDSFLLSKINLKEMERTILIVDDVMVNILLLKRLFEIYYPKMNLIEVYDGEEAVEACKKITPFLILMDIQLPAMDGYEATREIIRLQENQESKSIIIALTANVVKEEKQKCFDAGMVDYISKPIDKILFNEVLNQYFLGNVPLKNFQI